MAGDILRLDQIYRPAVVILDPETRRPLAPEAVMSRLGEVGLIGGIVDPSLPEPSELAEYSPENDGRLGMATFEALKAFVESRGATQALATNIWQPFAQLSSRLASNAALFDATRELRATREELISNGQGSSAAAQAIDNEIVEAHTKITGENRYIYREDISEVADSIVRFGLKDPAEQPKPFVFKGSCHAAHEKTPLIVSGRGIGRQFKGSHIDLDTAYALYTQGKVMDYVNVANKARPFLVNFFNQRIDMLRTGQEVVSQL